MNEERKEPVLGEVTSVAIGVFAYDLKRKAEFQYAQLLTELAKFLRPNLLPGTEGYLTYYAGVIAGTIAGMPWDVAEQDMKAGKTIGALVKSVTGLDLIPPLLDAKTLARDYFQLGENEVAKPIPGTLPAENPCGEVVCRADGCEVVSCGCYSDSPNPDCVNEGENACRKENETPQPFGTLEYYQNADREARKRYTHPAGQEPTHWGGKGAATNPAKPAVCGETPCPYDTPDGDPTGFQAAARPLMKWLADNMHPHATVIVTSNQAELVEGSKVYNTDEFIND